ncbi:uncharacterized protein LOC121013089 [Herpailurus yagouaroundi]|uniref:uncharacterized protein LOC121013089 n=1 Tax=Herpailurus yagouaroundi TaxID=1608482 RepID=UPI001AD768C0|nr:uncharacterized protein LOC121013089 [Puma yagouaroundi]
MQARVHFRAGVPTVSAFKELMEELGAHNSFWRNGKRWFSLDFSAEGANCALPSEAPAPPGRPRLRSGEAGPAPQPSPESRPRLGPASLGRRAAPAGETPSGPRPRSRPAPAQPPPTPHAKSSSARGKRRRALCESEGVKKTVKANIYQEWGSNPRGHCPLDLKSNALTTRPSWYRRTVCISLFLQAVFHRPRTLPEEFLRRFCRCFPGFPTPSWNDLPARASVSRRRRRSSLLPPARRGREGNCIRVRRAGGGDARLVAPSRTRAQPVVLSVSRRFGLSSHFLYQDGHCIPRATPRPRNYHRATAREPGNQGRSGSHALAPAVQAALFARELLSAWRLRRLTCVGLHRLALHRLGHIVRNALSCYLLEFL